MTTRKYASRFVVPRSLAERRGVWVAAPLRAQVLAVLREDILAAEFEPEKYHDQYKEALAKVIEEKIAAGGKPLPKEKAANAKPAPFQPLL